MRHPNYDGALQMMENTGTETWRMVRWDLAHPEDHICDACGEMRVGHHYEARKITSLIEDLMPEMIFCQQCMEGNHNSLCHYKAGIFPEAY